MINQLLLSGNLAKVSENRITSNNKQSRYIIIQHKTFYYDKEYIHRTRVNVFNVELINKILSYKMNELVKVECEIGSLNNGDIALKLLNIRKETSTTELINIKKQQYEKEKIYKETIKKLQDKSPNQEQRILREKLQKDIQELNKMDNNYYKDWIMTDKEKENYRLNYLKMNNPTDEQEYTIKKYEQQVIE